MKNKMISALLATAMVASMITVPVLASEGETEAAASVDLSNVEAKEAYTSRSYPKASSISTGRQY